MFISSFLDETQESVTAKIWDRLTRPHALIRELGQRRRARLLSSLLLVLIPLGVLVILLTPLRSQLPEFERVQSQIYHASFTGILFLAIAYGISRTHYYTLAAWMTIGTILLAVYATEIIHPDATTLPSFLILGVVLSSLLLSFRATILVLVITLAGVALFPIFLPDLDKGHVFDVFRLVLLVGGLALAAARVNEQDLEQIERQSQDLSSSEKRFRALIENASDAILLLDAGGTITYTGPSTDRITGYTNGENVGRNLIDWIHPDDVHLAAGMLNQLLRIPASSVAASLRYRHRDNSWHWMEGTAANLLDEPNVEAIVINYRDITERKQIEDALHESRERYRGLFEDSPVSLWEEDFSAVKRRLENLQRQGVTDFQAYLEKHPDVVVACAEEIRIVDVNNATLKLYRAENKAALLKNLRLILSDDSFESFRAELVNIAEGKTEFEWEGTNRTLGGDELTISLRWYAMPGYEDTLAKVIVSVTDITERKRAEEKLEYASTHDALTGLYNRAYFNEELARLERSRQFPISVVIVDVDEMKVINDNYGHAAGDAQLQRTARVLSAAFRAEDTAARVGGDEFSVLLPGTQTAVADRILARVRKTLASHNDDSEGYPLSLSIGVSTANLGDSLTQALKEADDRMYREKQGKKRE
ncbi:MAG: diguanylate cyclase [Chloroflexi bacterium]|nr:diguanylate cyclase [Chloroflexota bacterium]